MAIVELQQKFLSSSSETRLAPEDFYVLLAHASEKSKEHLLAHPEYELDAEAEARAQDFFARRLKHEPVAYIIGKKEFFGLPFHVTSETLIPRPETELLVEQVIEQLTVNKKQKSDRSRKILIADIGTGSGAIIISIAHTLGKDTGCMIHDVRYEFHAVDISNDALIVARENAEQNGVANIISFHEGNLFEPIEIFFSKADEIILIANLPYLSETIYNSATTDVTMYEPKEALLSGNDGLGHYREFLASIRKNICSLPAYHLTVFCEISPEQDALITELFEKMFPGASSQVIPDLSGRSRFFSFRTDKG